MSTDYEKEIEQWQAENARQREIFDANQVIFIESHERTRKNHDRLEQLMDRLEAYLDKAE